MLHLLAKHYHKLPTELLRLDYEVLMLNAEILAQGLRREQQHHDHTYSRSSASSLEEEIDRKRRALAAKWRYVS
jgi:UDP-N-acetylglucosamine transferase subunit ALG13